MISPSLDHVKNYYDERIDEKIRDFTDFNPRIEAAVQALAEWAPAKPKRVLEIGCGIGATSWRMARAWPDAHVTGADVSPASIEVARTCFRRDNLDYCEGLVTQDTFSEKFDLVVLMDVYEHIVKGDRPALHAALRSFLADEARVVLSFPTPACLHYAAAHNPSGLQPVDEDINLDDVMTFAERTDTNVLYYRELGIWRYGDYAHLVLGRYQKLSEVEARAPGPHGLSRIKQGVKRLLGVRQSETDTRSDYLGADLLCAASRNTAPGFNVSARERRRLTSLWWCRDRNNRSTAPNIAKKLRVG
jgi:SAM-dependent methyltransferase